jgi:hypothetical protein
MAVSPPTTSPARAVTSEMSASVLHPLEIGFG